MAVLHLRDTMMTRSCLLISAQIPHLAVHPAGGTNLRRSTFFLTVCKVYPSPITKVSLRCLGHLPHHSITFHPPTSPKVPVGKSHWDYPPNAPLQPTLCHAPTRNPPVIQWLNPLHALAPAQPVCVCGLEETRRQLHQPLGIDSHDLPHVLLGGQHQLMVDDLQGGSKDRQGVGCQQQPRGVEWPCTPWWSAPIHGG